MLQIGSHDALLGAASSTALGRSCWHRQGQAVCSIKLPLSQGGLTTELKTTQQGDKKFQGLYLLKYSTAWDPHLRI